ncbi:MAG: hypothetical protein HYZ17_12025 [Betaproteobacteria bacterium]|nr:hypothetical protein [Betaproteobacteria bacterium]
MSFLRLQFVAVGLMLLSLAAPASAQVLVLSGTIDGSDPTMPVVFITNPTCAAQGVTPVLYEARPFYVAATGVYNLSQASLPASFASWYLYEYTFSPLAGTTNCVAAMNGPADPLATNVTLQAFRQYIAVPFDDTVAQTGGSYTLTITGPGVIAEGAPAFAAVPALHTWALLGLAALLGLGGLLRMKRRI